MTSTTPTPLDPDDRLLSSTQGLMVALALAVTAWILLTALIVALVCAA